MEKLKRYIIFIVGLYINSLGVSMVTKANLGTSPISSIPYVLSLKFPFTLGQFTMIFSIFLIGLQLIILKKNFKLEHVLQIPVSIAFGYFIDLSMGMLFFVNPKNYGTEIVFLLIGCVILGVGVYLEVLANVVMLPGESFVRAVVLTCKKEFGVLKVVFDVSMTVIAGVLSFVFFGTLHGVREGTIVAAILVGFIARFLGRILDFLPEKIYGDIKEEVRPIPASDANKICIVIGREYGSGGHDYGKHLADKLGFSFYDNKIIDLTAKQLGYKSGYIARKEETMSNSLLYDLVNQMYAYSSESTAPKDAIYITEEKLIREFAEKGNCVIVGRCADYILKNDPRCLRVFLHAPLDIRKKRVALKEKISEEEAENRIRKKDKQRADNYRYYTRQIWGFSGNYHLSLDTSAGEEFLDFVVMNAISQIE